MGTFTGVYKSITNSVVEAWFSLLKNILLCKKLNRKPLVVWLKFLRERVLCSFKEEDGHIPKNKLPAQKAIFCEMLNVKETWN